ncbi:EamA family transporter [Phaeovulum sp. W22_SRMD_FR3]|uniref:EamA family transporter n=1 Tax=Phaeovulum sp. W22_SRMD_FR3 TaxID=3240274 RepID=UPI003F94657D
MIPALLGLDLLIALRQARPVRRDLASLGFTAAGVVIGFPLLTALALRQMTSAHSIVFIGLLPLATALFAVLRGGERPGPVFWLFSGAGSLAVAGFAEGAVLSRRLGGWQVISWALVL